MRNTYKIVVVKPERKRQLQRAGRRWEDSIKIYFKEIRCEDVNWIHLAQDRVHWRDVVNTVMNLQDLHIVYLVSYFWRGLGIFVFTTMSRPALGPS
jgi:hypothetical protein